jgi:predicted transcriptional regulator
MMSKKRTKAGRPPRHAGERLSKNRTFRVRDELDAKLQAAAKQSHRTVSAEIEHRLEQSFYLDDLDAEMRAIFGQGFKEAGMVPLSDLGLSYEERIKRWAKRITKAVASIDDSRSRRKRA